MITGAGGLAVSGAEGSGFSISHKLETLHPARPRPEAREPNNPQNIRRRQTNNTEVDILTITSNYTSLSDPKVSHLFRRSIPIISNLSPQLYLNPRQPTLLRIFQYAES